MFATYEAVIKSCRCDVCKERAVGVEHLNYGVPVLFECRACQPKGFAAAAERLAGKAVADVLGWATS